MSAAGLVIFIVAHEVSGLSVPALKRAAGEVLGADTAIRVETLSEPREDNALLQAAPKADSVVELSWADDNHQTVILHFFLKNRGHWLDRQITFDPSDAEEERGRTVGFALSSMLVADQGLSRLRAPQPSGVQAAAVPTREDHALDLAGLLTTGFGGFANGGGAAAGFELRLWRPIWLRSGASLRFGDIPPAQATSRDISAFTGFTWRPLARAEGRVLTFGINTDAGVDWLRVTHLSADDTKPAHRSSLLGVFHATADAEFAVSGSTGIFVGAGVEFASVKTEIYTRNQRVAIIPLMRGLGFLGIRTLF